MMDNALTQMWNQSQGLYQVQEALFHPCSLLSMADLSAQEVMLPDSMAQTQVPSVLWAYERPLQPWLKSLVRSALGSKVWLRMVRSFPMALAELSSRSFELLLTGHVLEHGSGFQLVQSLREKNIWTPAVLLTYRGDEDLAARCLEEGFAAYLAGEMLRDTPRVSQRIQKALEEGLRRKKTAAFLRQVGQMAITDPLTSLYNRFFMERLLEMETSRCLRYGEPFCVALLDLDGFKKVNDLLGHLRGDQLLVELAQVLKKTVRATDHIGRYGGDEFLMILPKASLVNGISLCTRIIQAVRSRDSWVQAPNPKISLSIGLTHWRGDQALAWESILEKTDRVLYQAKKKGKNRICYEFS